jgi:hypothetical protein
MPVTVNIDRAQKEQQFEWGRNRDKKSPGTLRELNKSKVSPLPSYIRANEGQHREAFVHVWSAL